MEDTEISHMPHDPTQALHPLVSTSATRVVHLLQLMNLPHDHPQSVVYIQLFMLSHSTCLDKHIKHMYLILWYHTEYFHCHKNHLCSIYSSFPPFQALIFILSLSYVNFAFFRLLCLLTEALFVE